MRLVNWNLWWRFGPWEMRQPAIVSTLQNLDADVVFLQEAWAEVNGDRQVDVIGPSIGLPYTAYATRHAHEGVAIGNGIMSRWPLSDVEEISLPTPAGLESRVAICATVEHPDRQFTAVSVHLSPEVDRSDARSAELAFLFNRLSKFDHQVFFGADFNATLQSAEISAVLRGSSAVALGVVDSGLEVDTVSHDNPYLSNDDPSAQRRIDFVLLPSTARMTNACIAGVDSVDEVQPSDHYAVVVDVEWFSAPTC